MPVRHVSYEAEGWGTGELVFEGRLLAWHELPRVGVVGNGSDDDLADRLVRYFAGEADDFLDIELDLSGATEFERELTRVLRGLPRGETVAYGELAALAGRPNAQRAAGTFCARNRFAIIVPCHRVVAAGGIGSYGSLGVEYKRRLLELEGVAV